MSSGICISASALRLVRRSPNVPLLAADDVARAVMYAVNQPEGVDVGEVVIRSVDQAS
jgi:NADP-dependent 3-hydroxy acid dehydrogenase YdfG